MITEPEVQSCTIKLIPSCQRSHLTYKQVVTICFCQTWVLHRRKLALPICTSNLKESEYETIFLPVWLHWKIILISLHWLTERIMKDFFFNPERRSSDFSTTFSIIFGCLVSWIALVESRILAVPCLSCWLLFTLNKKILTLTLDVLTDLDTKGDVSEKQQESRCYFNYCVFIHIYIEIAHWEKHAL